MKHARFRRILILGIAACLAATTWSGRAGITINFGAAELRGFGGADLIPSGSLILLVASTLDNDFAPPTPDNFVSGDDIILASFGADVAGEAAVDLALDFSGNWGQGDLLQMRWFPTLEITSSKPGAGTYYGEFRSDAAMSLSSPWVTPGNGANIGLGLVTSYLGGDSPDSAGYANLTVVPEPITVSLAIFGALALGTHVVRRVRRRC